MDEELIEYYEERVNNLKELIDIQEEIMLLNFEIRALFKEIN